MNRICALLLVSLAVGLPAAAQAPVPPVPAGTDSARSVAVSPFEKAAHEFVADFNEGRFEEATKSFNDDMKTVVTPDVLKGMKERADAQVGAFRSIREVRLSMRAGIATEEFTLAYEKSDVLFAVVMDRYGRIASIYFTPIVEEKVDPALERMARDLLAAINAGRFDSAGKNFDAKMKKDLTPAKLAVLAKQLQQVFGRFRTIDEVQQKTEPAQTTVDLIAAYEKAPVKLSVMFDAKKTSITGMLIQPVRPDAAH